MLNIIIAFLAVVGFFTIATAMYLVKLHLDNIVTIQMNKKAAEREAMINESRSQTV